MQLPTIKTNRLILRPFSISDSDRVRALAGDKNIYETTLRIPHPYQSGVAEKWITTHASQFENSDALTLAITLQSNSELIGSISLEIEKAHSRAGLGYWIGLDYWNNGYCTEATKVVIQYGFDTIGLHKIVTHHFAMNPASGRVMEKAGMKQEGILVDEIKKDGIFHTLIVYGIINKEKTRQLNNYN